MYYDLLYFDGFTIQGEILQIYMAFYIIKADHTYTWSV